MSRFGLFALGAMLLTQLASAQPAWRYTYTGNKYSTATGAYTSDMRFTLGFSTPTPVPKNFNGLFDVRNVATQVTVSDGLGTFSGLSPNNAFVVFHIRATDGDGIPLAWDAIINLYWVCPYSSFLDGTASGSLTGANEYMRHLDCRTGFPIFGVGASQTLGLWTIAAPSPATLTAYLLTLVTQMNILEQGKSLTHELTVLLNDINNDTLGQACSDLTTFSDHVTAQTGKKITTAQAAQIQTWVGYIGSGISCP